MCNGCRQHYPQLCLLETTLPQRSPYDNASPADVDDDDVNDDDNDNIENTISLNTYHKSKYLWSEVHIMPKINIEIKRGW